MNVEKETCSLSLFFEKESYSLTIDNGELLCENKSLTTFFRFWISEGEDGDEDEDDAWRDSRS